MAVFPFPNSCSFGTAAIPPHPAFICLPRTGKLHRARRGPGREARIARTLGPPAAKVLRPRKLHLLAMRPLRDALRRTLGDPVPQAADRHLRGGQIPRALIAGAGHEGALTVVELAPTGQKAHAGAEMATAPA